jgi:hypothetical protein
MSSLSSETKTVVSPAKVIEPSTTCCEQHCFISNGNGVAHYKMVDGAKPIRLHSVAVTDEDVNKMLDDAKEKPFALIHECRTVKCSYMDNPAVISYVSRACHAYWLERVCKTKFSRDYHATYFYKPEEWTFVGNVVDCWLG